MRLKIAVSAVRFCPWPPHGPSGHRTGGPTPRRPAPPAPRRQRSSAVEQPIRNRQVVGSNPTVGSTRPRPGLGPGGASVSAALLAQAWARYRGQPGAAPLTIGGGPTYLLPGRVTNAIPSGSPPSTNVRTTVDEPTSIS